MIGQLPAEGHPHESFGHRCTLQNVTSGKENLDAIGHLPDGSRRHGGNLNPYICVRVCYVLPGKIGPGKAGTNKPIKIMYRNIEMIRFKLFAYWNTQMIQWLCSRLRFGYAFCSGLQGTCPGLVELLWFHRLEWLESQQTGTLWDSKFKSWKQRSAAFPKASWVLVLFALYL